MIHATFTRKQIVDALARIGHSHLADSVYSRPTYGRPPGYGPNALAIDIDGDSDPFVLVAALVPLLGPEVAVFAASTRSGRAGHPAGPGRSACWWPGWVLDEPTYDQWTDRINECAACQELDDLCAAHVTAPWERNQPTAVAP